jgi:hypothetical protein
MTSKATFYLDEDLLRAFKVKAAESDLTLSYLVNEAMRMSLREDESDLSDARKRAPEPARSFEAVLSDLKRAKRL